MKRLLIICGIMLTLGPAAQRAVAGETNRLLSEIVFVAFDLETTGFSPREHRIIEIGAVKFINGKEIARKNWLINPGMPIPEASRRIHGITDEMVAESPSFAEVFPEIKAFLGNAVLLAHNAHFDIRFLAAEIGRNGFSLPGPLTLDTLALARSWFPDLPNHKLETLAEHLALDPVDTHRAAADAARVMNVFIKGTARQPNAHWPRDFTHVMIHWPATPTDQTTERPTPESPKIP